MFIGCSKPHVTKLCRLCLRASLPRVTKKSAKKPLMQKQFKQQTSCLLSGAIKSSASNRSMSCTICSTSLNNQLTCLKNKNQLFQQKVVPFLNKALQKFPSSPVPSSGAGGFAASDCLTLTRSSKSLCGGLRKLHQLSQVGQHIPEQKAKKNY